jgi:hypothetical protein
VVDLGPDRPRGERRSDRFHVLLECRAGKVHQVLQRVGRQGLLIGKGSVEASFESRGLLGRELEALDLEGRDHTSVIGLRSWELGVVLYLEAEVT